MPIVLALTSLFGKAVSKRLLDALASKPNGAQRLEQASAAMAKGLSAIEALKTAFGDDFLRALNGVLGTSATGRFSYEAGVASYIKADGAPASSPIAMLRDELNINLDRICIATQDKGALKNQFKGAFSVWKMRFQELAPDHHGKDAKATFDAIDGLLGGNGKSAPEVSRSLVATGVGAVGTLLIANGISLITGTGVGLLMAIWMFFMGIPWLAAGCLIVLGLLLIALVLKLARPDNTMSKATLLAYGLLDRCAKAQ